MVSIENVLTSSSGDGQIEEGEVKVEIYVTTTIPIHSYSFTLEGFGYDHVIHDPYDVIEQESGTFNFQNHVLDNYFYGGSVDGTMIQPQGDVLFLSFIASYDDSFSGHYLTFDEIIPGANGQGTSFFTSNGDGEFEEIPQDDIQWVKTTWIIGENGVHDYIGEDCQGEILGLAIWDDCGACTGGSTDNPYNYQLDCMGVCEGDAEIHDYWYDSDGDGFGSGISEEFCDAEVDDDGWVTNGDDDDDGCYTADPGGEHDYDCAGVCNGTAFLDDCDICSGGNTGHVENSDQDCSGECFGDSEAQNWYADCDEDGLADGVTYIEICGYPEESIIVEICGQTGNMISIDPNNHTFDPHPDCTSNQVDECGSCDGPGKDCRGTCHPNSPLSIANFCWNSSPYVGYGSEINLTFESATNEGEEETYILEAGCRNFIGYDSDFDYSHDNGVDLCGECYIGDLIEGDAYNPNYSCQGCMDQHADNYDPTALFSDGSCSFQLYAGDVNRDGVVNELDIDGIAVFWNYWTEDERINPTIEWTPQFSQGNPWYTPDNIESQSNCPMFADTNGDALVESADVTAILNNWGNQVDSVYYYPWGYNGDSPNCLDDIYNEEQLRENYNEIYNYITNACPCDLEDEVIIDYLASLLDINDLVDYYGCTDLSATNFNSIATVDNGSCQYIPFPQDFKVYQNFPNPFNPVTQFPIDVNIESDVTLRIYNLSGSLVYEHSMKSMQPGSYHSNSPFKWNASEFSSGVYFYSFKSSTGENHYNKLMLIK